MTSELLAFVPSTIKGRQVFMGCIGRRFTRFGSVLTFCCWLGLRRDWQNDRQMPVEGIYRRFERVSGFRRVEFSPAPRIAPVMTRYAKRVDRNQLEVVKAFRKMGCWVADMSKIGQGMPDLLVSIPPSHALALVEVKDGDRVPSQRKLTAAQERLHEACPAMVWIVKDLADVETVVRYYKYG